MRREEKRREEKNWKESRADWMRRTEKQRKKSDEPRKDNININFISDDFSTNW